LRQALYLEISPTPPATFSYLGACHCGTNCKLRAVRLSVGSSKGAGDVGKSATDFWIPPDFFKFRSAVKFMWLLTEVNDGYKGQIYLNIQFRCCRIEMDPEERKFMLPENYKIDVSNCYHNHTFQNTEW